jgi:hypothetical protein
MASLLSGIWCSAKRACVLDEEERLRFIGLIHVFRALSGSAWFRFRNGREAGRQAGGLSGGVDYLRSCLGLVYCTFSDLEKCYPVCICDIAPHALAF